MFEKTDDTYYRIWRGYKIISHGAFVLRSGFPLMGLASMPDESESVPDIFYRRDESILEHSAKVAYLVSAFVSHFPGFFGSDKLEFDDCASELWTVITAALLHDVGELVIGDIPDDGNPMHNSKKDESEQEFFNHQMAPAYSLDDFISIRRMFVKFQEHSSTSGQALYCLDKIEAILTLLWLEQYEAYGQITSKPHPTKQDLDFMFLTGTPCATDCWAAHVKLLLKDIPTRITQHIYELLHVAVIDVRGEWFEWWDKI